jgi:hypothetical protein
VQVHHDEGVTNRIASKSCTAAREGISEASTGERIGQERITTVRGLVTLPCKGRGIN